MTENKIELYNDDCIKCMDKLISQNVHVDCIVTDPPYLTTPRGNAGNSGGMMQKLINKKAQLTQMYLFQYYGMVYENYIVFFITNCFNNIKLPHFSKIDFTF